MRNKRLIIIFSILLSLTLLIAIGSAVFSVRTVIAYCYNSDDETISETVISKVEEKIDLKGRSIFSLKEDEIIKSIEKNVNGIKVINIERLFPNRVSINFIKLYEYFETEYNGNYYRFSKDGRVTEKTSESAGDAVTAVKFDLKSEPTVGGTLKNEEGFAALADMTDMLERLDYRDVDTTVIIESIHLYELIGGKKSEIPTIVIKMRSGVTIRLEQYENAGQKLRKALSLYMAKPEYRRSGTITVTGAEEFTYLPQDA